MSGHMTIVKQMFLFQSGSDRSTPPFSLADGQSGDHGDILQELTESLRREKKLKHQVSAASQDSLNFLSMMIDFRHHTGLHFIHHIKLQ